MRKFLTLFALAMFSFAFSYAQKEVRGTVVNANGVPIQGASVTLPGTNKGTATDASGQFTINVPANGKLRISAVGQNDQTITVGDRTSLTVLLQTAGANNLEEVVVQTSLGQSRQKSSLGFATAEVRAKDLTQAKSTNFIQGITGKISGASINQTNSGVNQDTRIVLRGLRSLTGNNQPMLILDGVPISLSFLSSINPNDISDVNILKSASSTAVYGPDGVNGAIVVTTKKGSSLKPSITLSHSIQFETVSKMPDFQSNWGQGYDVDQVTGQGTYTAYEQQSYGDAFDGSIRDFGEADPFGFTRKQKYAYIPGERKRFFNTGMTNQTDISYSTKELYVSGQNVDITGTLPGDVATRRAATFKGIKEYNRFKATINVRFTQSKSNTASNNQLVWYGVASAPGNVPLTQYSDWRNDFFSSPAGYYTPYFSNRYYTPYVAKDINRKADREDDLFGNVQFDYKASDWLNFTYRLSMSNSTDITTRTQEALTPSPFFTQRPAAGAASVYAAQLSDQNNYASRLTSEAFANFNKEFGSVGLDGTVGYSFREIRGKTLLVGSSNLGQTTFLSIVNRLGEPNVTDTRSLARLDRVFGRVGLNFKKMVFVEGTASYDRDSRLAPARTDIRDSKIAFFYPSVNASILLDKIFPGIKGDVLNFAKIRGAVAKTGNVNLNPYQNEQSFSAGQYFPFGTTSGYQISNTVYPPNGLNPEFVQTKEAGIELGFFKNRINFEANYYNQNNTDQVLQVQLPQSTGATAAFLNTANFVNRGLEFDLKLTPLIKLGDASIDFKINYTHQKNEIKSLSEGVNELSIGNYNWAIVGQPAFVFKATDYNRDSASGKVIVGADGMPSLNNQISQIGTTLPTDIVGLSMNVNWRNITLSVVGQYSTGNKVIADDLGGLLDDNGISARSGANYRRAFVFPNSVIDDGSGKFVDNTNTFTTNYGRNFYNNGAYNTGAITNYTFSGAFWKLREVALTYEFPSTMFRGKGIKGITAGFSGRNLFMWLPKSNQWIDPEFQGGNGNDAYTGNATGRTTTYNLPPTRFMGANVSFQF